jgi:predicted glycosyltransferase involved in capsule biosynthesis
MTKSHEQNDMVNCKTNLTDLTFLVPLRVDSRERKDNTDSLIKYTFNIFKTNLIVLEADSVQRYFTEFNLKGFHYEFIEDTNSVFHRTKWINHLISMAETPYVAIWDADAIAPPEQIIAGVQKLRNKEAILCFPYDGRFYSCDKVSCDIFEKYLNIEILTGRIPVMRLMHGYHSVGGAFIVNKEEYMKAGGENENFFGWGPEDTERIKRLEILGPPIYYAKGVLFHLWHPKGKNSWFANSEIEKQNRKELQRTCRADIISQIE